MKNESRSRTTKTEGTKAAERACRAEFIFDVRRGGVSRPIKVLSDCMCDFRPSRLGESLERLGSAAKSLSEFIPVHGACARIGFDEVRVPSEVAVSGDLLKEIP